MMSKDDFIIADEDIDALMDELKHFSPSGSELFFSEAGRTSSRSGQTEKQDAARTATAGAAGRTAGGASPSPARVSASPASRSVQSGRPESSGVPSYTAQASAPPRKTEKKKHGFIWVLIVLAIIIFAYPRIKVNKKEPEPLQPEVTQPVIEQVVFPESRTEPMTVILRSAYYSHITEERLEALGSFLECKSISLEKGDLILDPAHDRDAMKTRLQQFFHRDLETLIGQPGCPHFTEAEVNEDCTVIKITVNDVNMSEDERKLADDILLYSTVYSGLSGKDNAEARIDFNNMLGQTVRTMNNG